MKRTILETKNKSKMNPSSKQKVAALLKSAETGAIEPVSNYFTDNNG